MQLPLRFLHLRGTIGASPQATRGVKLLASSRTSSFFLLDIIPDTLLKWSNIIRMLKWRSLMMTKCHSNIGLIEIHLEVVVHKGAFATALFSETREVLKVCCLLIAQKEGLMTK
jgi:hypothetical protein